MEAGTRDLLNTISILIHHHPGLLALLAYKILRNSSQRNFRSVNFPHFRFRPLSAERRNLACFLKRFIRPKKDLWMNKWTKLSGRPPWGENPQALSPQNTNILASAEGGLGSKKRSRNGDVGGGSPAFSNRFALPRAHFGRVLGKWRGCPLGVPSPPKRPFGTASPTHLMGPRKTKEHRPGQSAGDLVFLRFGKLNSFQDGYVAFPEESFWQGGLAEPGSIPHSGLAGRHRPTGPSEGFVCLHAG